MKKLVLMFMFVVVLQASAALTERYVNSAGSGDGTGSSEANAMSFTNFTDYMITGGSFTAAAGDRFNLIVGTYSRTTTTDTWVNGGSATSPVVVRGYSSAITDGYLGRTNGNGALITTNMPAITYTTGRVSVTGSFLILENLNFTSANSGVCVTLTADSFVLRCKIVNSSTNAAAAGVTIGTRNLLFDCDVDLTGASGGAQAVGATNVNNLVIDSCRIKVVSTCPAILCAGSTVIYGNTIYGSGGIGISMNSTTGTPFIRNNTIQGCAGDGIDIVTGTTVPQRIIGNMITDNTGNGIDMVSAANAGFLAYNRTRDNGTAINSGTDWVSATSYGHVTTDTGGTSTDYTASGSSDFSLILASPATNANVPAYSSIGALQRQSASTGATSYTWGN